ncbi:MAG TPA: hypothetical protein VFY17_02855 [Pilimelia sp.]|nr:hypothetical protein [Pilimelia sp.]
MRPAPARTGWRRLLPRWSVNTAVLTVAVFASALLVFGPRLRDPGTGAPLRLADAWPAASVGTLPARLSAGAPHTPTAVLAEGTAAGTAPSPDGRTRRLVVVTGGSYRVLRALPTAADPLFAGLTPAGDHLLWAETVSGRGGAAVSALWAAPWRTPGPPRRLTADTGALAFFHSQYDLVVADGRVHWVAVAPGATPVTEVRSVPLAGGAVTVRQVPGQWALSAWPWLVSASSAGSGRAQRYDLTTDRRVDVPADPADLVTCGPAWCRVQVLGPGGQARLDLMRPDGGGRRRVAGPEVSAAVSDVALQDRFEVLTRIGAAGPPDSQQELLLYDAARGHTVALADGVDVVDSRAGWLWWSTGGAAAPRWHTLDLRALE